MDKCCEGQELKTVPLATNIGPGVDLDKARLRSWSCQIRPRWGLKDCFRFVQPLWTAAAPVGQLMAI
jgi:hypothetical protein